MSRIEAASRGLGQSESGGEDQSQVGALWMLLLLR